MTIGTAIYLCFMSAWLTYMLTMLISFERDRKRAEELKEKARRDKIRRDFERQMYNLEMYGRIEGPRVIYLEQRKDRRAV